MAHFDVDQSKHDENTIRFKEAIVEERLPVSVHENTFSRWAIVRPSRVVRGKKSRPLRNSQFATAFFGGQWGAEVRPAPECSCCFPLFPAVERGI
jgi:hypothetical protein